MWGFSGRYKLAEPDRSYRFTSPTDLLQVADAAELRAIAPLAMMTMRYQRSAIDLCDCRELPVFLCFS